MALGDDDTVANSSPTGGLAKAAETEPPDLVAGRYRIVRWLGGGGMGRVYEARDTELDEKVALKMLRTGLSDGALERFRREVRLTRKIQHPNVARMHDIGDHDGEKFLTMELVDGASLGREIGRTMDWQRLRNIALQLCAGLGAAHEKGVIHRDLKPDNVLIERRSDRAVITDFGIARSVDDPNVTGVGSVVGTPRYMSPEQLGGGSVDSRSDLFSLGVILFELASGTRPWQGENAISIAVAQATQPARAFNASSVPAGFGRVVSRCLHLDPDARYASARELAEALETLDTAVIERDAMPTQVSRPASPTAPQTRSQTTRSDSAPRTLLPTLPPTTNQFAIASTAVAVLPFDCAAGDEYLADGVLEDLIDTLSSTVGLRVRPAGRTRNCAAEDVREVGRSLEVDHIVTGSLRRTPAGLRISARLIGIADGFQIWAHRAEGVEADIFGLSEQLGRGIASALSTRATTPTRPTDPRAVDLYLRARAELRLYWGEHLRAAADLLDQAYELSPNSPAIAGARAFAMAQAWVMVADPVLAERARLAIERGLATGHAEAFLGSAQYRFNTNDPFGGASDLGTALVRAPMSGQANEMAGRILVEIAALGEARQHFETARSLDPTRAHIVAMDLARLDALEGYWERADRSIEAVVADPDPSIVQLGSIFKARLAMWRGDRKAMAEAGGVFSQRMGSHAGRLINFLSDAALTGIVDETVWQQFIAVFGGNDKPHRGQLMGLQVLSEIAVLLGRHELAFDTLEVADCMGLIDIVCLEKCPLFASVEDQPRFTAIRANVRARATKVLAAFRSTAG